MSSATGRTDAVRDTGAFPATAALRAALRANAVFSLFSGVSLAVAGPWLASAWPDCPRWLPSAIGVGVVGFALIVVRVAVQAAARLRRQALLVMVADVVWIAATAVVLATTPATPTGWAAAVLLAVAVAALAVRQGTGLRRYRSDDPLADDEVFEVVGDLPAVPALVWPLITNHDLYGRLAPGLSAVEVISEPGARLRRRCTNTGGRGWQETCTLWEQGRRFAVEVDTTDYPYPLESMRGLWQVDPAPGGSRVTMRFAYRARPTLTGGLFAIALRPVFPRLLNRILAGWHTESTPSSGGSGTGRR